MDSSRQIIVEKHYIPIDFYRNYFLPSSITSHVSPLSPTPRQTPSVRQTITPQQSMVIEGMIPPRFMNTLIDMFDGMNSPETETDIEYSITPAELNSNSIVSIAESESECPICKEPIKTGSIERILTRCGHDFHLTCIDRWVSSNSSCPVCRTSCKDTQTEPESPI